MKFKLLSLRATAELGLKLNVLDILKCIRKSTAIIPEAGIILRTVHMMAHGMYLIFNIQ